MSETLVVTDVLPASPTTIYHAWLNSDLHTAFTGGEAKIDPVLGGSFTAWDGYIQGKNLELTPSSRILQSWRTTDFPPDSPDSLLEVLLEEDQRGTRITLKHSNIPGGQADEYRKGWIDYYFSPMKAYFSTHVSSFFTEF